MQVKPISQSFRESTRGWWTGAPGTAFLRYVASLVAPPDELKTTQLRLLQHKSAYWVAVFLIGSLWINWTGLRPEGNSKPLLFFTWAWPIDLNRWTIGVWLMAIPILALRAWTSQWLINPRARLDVEGNSALWLILTTAFACWWSVGVYCLADQPPSGPEFVLANRTFIWLNPLFQVFTIVLLASNWLVVLSILGFGCLLPGFYFLAHFGTSARPSLYWMTGEVCAFFIVSLLFHMDQRFLLKRRISLEKQTALLEAQRETLQKQRRSLVDQSERSDRLLRELDSAKRKSNMLAFQKGRLLSNFSHDLINPVAALDFDLNGIRKLSCDPEIVMLLDEADIQRSSILAIIEDARDLADAEAGDYPWKKREVSLEILLTEVVSSLKYLAHSKQIRISFFAPPWLVYTDKAILERMVGNLVSNAIKYTDEGGHVLIGCRRAGATVKIGVYDNGIGIPASRQEEIFEEFVQLENPERDRHKGVGLGLSIVRAFSRLLSHPLRLTSEVNKGSAFSVEVPYVGKVPPELRPRGITGSESIGDVDLHGLRVAIVEDDRWQREAFVRQIAVWKGQAVAGSSGVDLQAKLGSASWNTFDLLITDYRLMRGETGAQVINLMRGLYGRIPVIVWSANASKAIRNELADSDVTIVSKGRLRDLADSLSKYVVSSRERIGIRKVTDSSTAQL
jgi:two-component system, sensor histidine kinase